MGDDTYDLDAETFHHIMRDRGGRADLGILDPAEAEDIRSLLNRARRAVAGICAFPSTFPTMPRVYVDLIEDHRVNAVARLGTDCAFIGINLGAVQVIRTVFAVLLSHPTFFQNIGDTSKDPSEPLPRLGRLPWTAATLMGIVPAQSTYFPDSRDLTRRTIGFILTCLALDALVMHELAHIRHGHLALMRSATGMADLEEIGSRKGLDDIDVLTRHTLEMDADSYAFNFGLEELLACWTKSGRVTRGHSLQVATFDTAFSIWFFALDVLFRIFGAGVGAGFLANLGSGEHPPPELRRLWLGATVDAHLVTLKRPDLLQMALSTGVRASVLTESVFSILTGDFVDVERSQALVEPRALRYVAHMERHWKTVVRPQLVPLAHREGLAP